MVIVSVGWRRRGELEERMTTSYGSEKLFKKDTSGTAIAALQLVLYLRAYNTVAEGPKMSGDEQKKKVIAIPENLADCATLRPLLTFHLPNVDTDIK